MPAPFPSLSGDLRRRGLGLRRQEAADTRLLRRLYGEARAEELACVAWPDDAKAAFLDSQFALQSAHFEAQDADLLIVTCDGEAIGRLYTSRAGERWRLLDITIGARQAGRGLGTALVQWLAEEARRAGASSLDLHVARNNPRAEALYRRIGFAEVPSLVATHKRMELRWPSEENFS